MIADLNLPPYSAYKPSGVDWLGDVPAHWEVRKAQDIFASMNSGDGITPSGGALTVCQEHEYPVLAGPEHSDFEGIHTCEMSQS